jgi:hypothetical protein
MRTYDTDKVKIKDKDMVRDMKSKAILSTNIEALNAYRDRKKAMEEVTATRAEIDDMKADINSIKEDLKMVMTLLNSMVMHNR